MTGWIPAGAAALDGEFDLLREVLVLRASDGRDAEVPLREQSVASFYAA